MVLNNELRDLENLPSALMICYLNGFTEAKEKLITAKAVLKFILLYTYRLRRL
jgi:hypothetical protein